MLLFMHRVLSSEAVERGTGGPRNEPEIFSQGGQPLRAKFGGWSSIAHCIVILGFCFFCFLREGPIEICRRDLVAI